MAAVFTKRGNASLFTENPPAGAKSHSILNGPDERYKAGSIMLLG